MKNQFAIELFFGCRRCIENVIHVYVSKIVTGEEARLQTGAIEKQ